MLQQAAGAAVPPGQCINITFQSSTPYRRFRIGSQLALGRFEKHTRTDAMYRYVAIERAV